MEPVKKYYPADFTTEELETACKYLKKLTERYAHKFWPLGAMLNNLHGDIVQEMFIRLAGDDEEKRQELKKAFNSMHSQ